MSKKTESPLDFELHNACRVGDPVWVQRVLDSGRVHVDCQHDEDQLTPLMVAIMCRRRDCIQVLIAEGADPNVAKENGLTAIMLASQIGLEDVVRDLVRLGANVDATNQEGGTALMCAAQWGWLHIVEALIEAKCNIHQAMKDGTTALFLAAQAGHDKILSLLITECLKRNRDLGIFIGAPRQDGSSPLFIACQLGHVESVRILLENGAEVDQSRLDDATPLFKACHKGHLQIVQELLKYQAKVGMLPNGESCLHAAALSGSSALIEFLLAYNDDQVDPNLSNSEGRTPMDLAIQAGNFAIVELLKKHTNTSLSATCSSSSSSTSSLSPSMSCLKRSSNSTLEDGTTEKSTPKQHVRFDLQKIDQDGTRVDHHLGSVVRVHCRMVSSDDLRRQSQSPVRFVWKNSPLRQARSQEPASVEINSADCCSAVLTH
ncbi:hypothetical protein TCAL_09138 [Tigriopus californicus]|uniref:Uncharacterized protein n=1 Tax=Tigriopus californicus TaxID=6832 RepID=A0A553N923_TIGCA|nr:ankyrin repeat domain-containing protein 29-like [Tigriopus californicus]TRY61947.1 hypothetical protein TCAL_09138 [Tigriopus californicus]